MDEREVAETMRSLGYESTVLGGQAWYYPGDSRLVYKPDRKLTRWFATYVEAGFARHRQEFTCPVAAALWLAVEVA